MKIAVQCDFDGTVTVNEISHILLEEFAEGDWRSIVREFEAGRIPVKVCMERIFAMVKVDEAVMLNFLLHNDRVMVRSGFYEFAAYCREHGHRLFVISNGITFYIKAILERITPESIEVFAAGSQAGPNGMKLTYVGPDGETGDFDFKEAYTEYLEKEYGVVCIGDSISDLATARRARRVFATGSLLKYCRQESIACLAYDDFFDIIRGMES